jgi:hypothetical protein
MKYNGYICVQYRYYVSLIQIIKAFVPYGLWFSPGTPASSTTKTGRHDIAEILLKVALKHQKSKIKST